MFLYFNFINNNKIFYIYNNFYHKYMIFYMYSLLVPNLFVTIQFITSWNEIFTLLMISL